MSDGGTWPYVGGGESRWGSVAGYHIYRCDYSAGDLATVILCDLLELGGLFNVIYSIIFYYVLYLCYFQIHV